MFEKLQEFLLRLFSIKRWGRQVKGVFPRNRVPAEAKVLGTYLYAWRLGLRNLRDFLLDLGVETTHISVWKWFHRVDEWLKNSPSDERKDATPLPIKQKFAR